MKVFRITISVGLLFQQTDLEAIPIMVVARYDRALKSLFPHVFPGCQVKTELSAQASTHSVTVSGCEAGDDVGLISLRAECLLSAQWAVWCEQSDQV